MEAPFKSVWLIIGLFLLLLFPLATGILTRCSAPPDEDSARAIDRFKALQTLQTENQKKLETYQIADPAKGTFQIPIERAIDLTIPELNQRTPAPAGPVISAPSP